MLVTIYSTGWHTVCRCSIEKLLTHSLTHSLKPVLQCFAEITKFYTDTDLTLSNLMWSNSQKKNQLSKNWVCDVCLHFDWSEQTVEFFKLLVWTVCLVSDTLAWQHFGNYQTFAFTFYRTLCSTFTISHSMSVKTRN